MLRSCCLCLDLKTGAAVLSMLGIVAGVLLLVPMAVFLDHHDYYVTHYVTSEREAGRTMDEVSEVPSMAFFSQVFFSTCLSLDVVWIFCCILLMTGVTAVKHKMMLPSLIYGFFMIIIFVTLLLAFMISFSDYASVAVFIATAPELIIIIYLWFTVYSAYHLVKKEEISRRGPQTGITTQSASQSSISSFKEQFSKVIRGTPPPPYESVRSKTPPKPEKKKVVQQPSCSSLVDLLTSKSSSEQQSLRSSPSASRRSSDHSCIKSSSPVNIRKRGSGSDLAESPLVSTRPMTSSQSHSVQLSSAPDQGPLIRKSHSSMVSFTQSQPGQDLLIKLSNTSLDPTLTTDHQIKETDNDELSDETSSMSSTSLSIHDNNKIV